MRHTVFGGIAGLAGVLLLASCSPNPQIIEGAIMSGLFTGTPQPAVAVARQLCKANVAPLELNITTIRVSDIEASGGSGTATLHIKRPKGECSGRVAFNYTATAEWVKRAGRRPTTGGRFVAHDFRVVR
jgi:hypothetical protein